MRLKTSYSAREVAALSGLSARQAEVLELAYIGVYPLIPIALALHLLYVPDADAGRFRSDTTQGGRGAPDSRRQRAPPPPVKAERAKAVRPSEVLSTLALRRDASEASAKHWEGALPRSDRPWRGRPPRFN